MNIRQFVDNYIEYPYVEQRAGLAAIKTQEELEELLHLATHDKSRIALRILADLGKRAAEFVKARQDVFLDLLHSDDSKTRALAAEILGNTDAAAYLDQLIAALDAERTMYVLPSYLLAIGNAKNEKAHAYLKTYTVRSDVDKHAVAEKEALKKALANFTERRKSNVRVLSSDIIVTSTPNVEVTMQALRAGGFRPKKFGHYAAVTGLNSFNDIYKVRAYDTAYIYLGSCELADIAEFMKSREDAIFQRTQVTSYRVEVNAQSHALRLDVIKKCVAAMDKLQNSPSSYSIEIFIDVEDNRARVFLNPLTDERFSYRKKALPASMSCSTAACVCAYASRYFDPDARVLDDFCGAGTFLFERGYYPHHTLTGVDINPAAIEAADYNARYARVHPQFHYGDALRFTAKRYNEVMANLPFGMRVGSHEQNRRLYAQYIGILPQITTQGALIVLFTHEKKLTDTLIEQNEQLEFVHRTTFDAGGLYPAAYILRRDDSSYATDRTDLR